MSPRCDICLRSTTTGACPDHPYADLLDPLDPTDRQLIQLRQEMLLDSRASLFTILSFVVLIVPTAFLLARLDPRAAIAYALLAAALLFPCLLLFALARLWLRLRS